MKPETHAPLQAPKGRGGRVVEKTEEVHPDDDQDGDLPLSEWPTKCVHYKQIFCKIDFIEVEGRADSESVQKIIGQIKPKQLVIIHGNPASTRRLSEACQKQKAVQDRIFTPSLGEVVDLTIESHIFQVTLSDPLMSSLLFQPVRDVELSWVDARLRRRKPKEALEYPTQKKSEESDRALADYGEPMEVDEGRSLKQPFKGLVNAEQLCLEVLASSNIPSHEAVFVNDPKLSDLKTYLTKNGLQAEFSGGELYVNDTLKISRSAGKFMVEGPASEEYYRIRDVVYTQFAIV